MKKKMEREGGERIIRREDKKKSFGEFQNKKGRILSSKTLN